MTFTQALDILIDQARGDTGGSRRCAAFLLSLWNGDIYKADLQELLYTDTKINDAMILVFRHLHVSNNQLYTYVSEQQMLPIDKLWGKTFKKVA